MLPRVVPKAVPLPGAGALGFRLPLDLQSGAGQLLGVLVPPRLPAADPEESGVSLEADRRVCAGSRGRPSGALCQEPLSKSGEAASLPRAATAPSLRPSPGLSP